MRIELHPIDLTAIVRDWMQQRFSVALKDCDIEPCVMNGNGQMIYDDSLPVPVVIVKFRVEDAGGLSHDTARD